MPFVNLYPYFCRRPGWHYELASRTELIIISLFSKDGVTCDLFDYVVLFLASLNPLAMILKKYVYADLRVCVQKVR
jgi:hypothetical protein